MSRATRARGEGLPTGPHASVPAPTSLEPLIALLLCGVVILASMAFLRRSGELSRSLAALHSERDERRPRPRHPGANGSAVAPPELVILVSLDGLRADRLAPRSSAGESAPRLSALARESLVFRTVCAQAAHPLISHKSLLTGKYPATLMLELTGADLVELATLADPRAYLVETFTSVAGTLAAGFAAQGFRTAAFTDGGWADGDAGFAHGFDVADDAGGGLERALSRALAWLDEERTRRALLFVHADDLHAALRGPNRAAPSGSYDAAVAEADARLGGFLDALRARGLHDEALIVVTSSHGESLGERGRVGHGGLALEQLLVPLVVKLPRSWNVVARAIDEPVELVDLLPTLDALAGVPVPAALDGRSLAPTIFRGVRGRDHLVAQTVLGEGAEPTSPSTRTLLRPGRWQVVHDVARARADFFPLARDPSAPAPYPIAEHEFAPLLDLLLDRGIERARRGPARDDPPTFGAELERELAALGYGDAAFPSDASDLR